MAVYVNGSLVFSRHVAKGLAFPAWASATSRDNEMNSADLPPGSSWPATTPSR